MPRLASGPSAGLPRVYGIALELISHADGRVDGDSLRAFVAAYQSVRPLRLGELWAIPIMLRLALLENLRRVAFHVMTGPARARAGRATGSSGCSRSAAKEPAKVVLVLAEMVRENPPLTTAFVAEFASRLQGQGPALVFAVTWLEQRLAEQGQTIEQRVPAGEPEPGRDQVSIGNSIGSLRFLGATDWREFVEAMSVVEHTLRADPAGVYPAMDFATRDYYRHAVEQIARRRPTCPRTRWPARPSSWPDARRPTAARRPGPRDAGAAGRATSAISWSTAAAAPWSGPRGVATTAGHVHPARSAAVPAARLPGLDPARHGGRDGRWCCGGLRGIGSGRGSLAASASCSLVVARASSRSRSCTGSTMLLVRPRILPRLDFSKGIPAEHRTVGRGPDDADRRREIDDLLEALEVRFLANRDENLSFALLTDFRDAPTETTPADAALLQRARDGIDSAQRQVRGDKADGRRPRTRIRF